MTNQMLFDKDTLQIIRIDKNKYNIEFEIINPNIILPQIIDFSSCKLLYELNKDLIENIEIYNIENNLENKNISTANVYILYKHLFKDFGLPQMNIHVKVTRSIQDKFLTFITESSSSKEPINTTTMPIDNCSMRFDIITPHLLRGNMNLELNSTFDIPAFLEKPVIQIFYKIFMRIKQFIENYK